MLVESQGAKVKNRKKLGSMSKSRFYGDFCMVVGGGALLTSWWFGSIMPIIVVGVGLFGILSFLNGLG